MKTLAVLATVLGIAAFSAGAALVNLPAGIMVLGASLTIAGLFAIEVDRK